MRSYSNTTELNQIHEFFMAFQNFFKPGINNNNNISATIKVEPLVDLFGLGKMIHFNQIQHHLIEASSPQKNLYSQQYLAAAGHSDFDRKLIVQFYNGDLQMEDFIALKLKSIQLLSNIEPLVEFSINLSAIKNEPLLRFCTPVKKRDKQVIEFHHYRYCYDSNEKAVKMFGLILTIPEIKNNYLTSLWIDDEVNKFMQTKMPEIFYPTVQ